ncbi:CopD family protein [Deinococcus rufus]|uniref:CopD family protein n=1 Tax=Deinococcus rufus TaxID=2136097 RepID=A0ABV7ZA08_9DEIO
MDALLTALSYAGLALLLGSVLARRWLTPGQPGLGPGAAGLALLLLAWAGQTTVTLHALGMTAAPDVLAYVTSTATGRAMLTGLLGATLLLAVEVAAWPTVLALLAAGVTVWGAAGVGHGDGHGTWVRTLHAAHAAAMTVWVGGVLSLVTVRPLGPALARRFTPAALGSVVVLAATGILMATEHLTALREWTASAYGQTLLVKLGLVALALLAAVLVRRAFARRRGARIQLVREALLLVAVLGITAVLANSAPPGGHDSGHTTHLNP